MTSSLLFSPILLQVIPAEEHAAKIASARHAIGDSDFFLVARTDARATSAKTGLSDAIARANLYMEVIILKSQLALNDSMITILKQFPLR